MEDWKIAWEIYGAKGEMKKTVSEKFYNYCMKKYPELKKKDNYAYREFFIYLCFSNFLDRDTKNLCIPSYVIANCVGKQAVISNDYGNFKSGEFLENFKRDVLPDFQWVEAFNDWITKTTQCRLVENKGFDDDMMKMLTEELAEDNKEMLFVSGKKWSNLAKLYIRSENKEEHLEKMANIIMNPTQQKIYDYMETISGIQFIRKFNENKGMVLSQIGLLDEETQRIQYRILATMKEDSVIHYYPGKRSPRMSAAGDTIVGLKSSVRHRLCKGWTECDLKSSQFAILASKLNAPLSKELVLKNESIWESFHRKVFGHINDIKKVKRVYKTILYGIAFGNLEKTNDWVIEANEKITKSAQNKNTIRNKIGLPPLKEENIPYVIPLDQKLKEFSKEFNTDFTILLQHPIVRELFDARTTYHDTIRKFGGDYDVWGKFIGIDKSKNRYARHIAAIIMQSIELELFSVVFDVANEKGKAYQFTIPIFQHDGCCISFSDKKHKEYIMKCLKEAVEKKGKELKVITTIEGEDL
jgi:hypothetical protein